MKIENKTTVNANIDKLIQHINNVLNTVPPAHLRGITQIMLVDNITDLRLDSTQRAQLPGLYHPKMSGSQPWIEIALQTLLSDSTWFKRLGKRLALKTNLTTTLLSLVAQHYYMTLSHGIKKNQIETVIRVYVEKQMGIFAQSQQGIRATLMRPFRPILERLARWVRKRYHEELKKQAMTQRLKK